MAYEQSFYVTNINNIKPTDKEENVCKFLTHLCSFSNKDRIVNALTEGMPRKQYIYIDNDRLKEMDRCLFERQNTFEKRRNEMLRIIEAVTFHSVEEYATVDAELQFANQNIVIAIQMSLMLDIFENLMIQGLYIIYVSD